MGGGWWCGMRSVAGIASDSAHDCATCHPAQDDRSRSVPHDGLTSIIARSPPAPAPVSVTAHCLPLPLHHLQVGSPSPAVVTSGLAVLTPMPQEKLWICVCVTVADQKPAPVTIVGEFTPVDGLNLSFVVS